MTETLANGYSSETSQRELSNEYPHDRVKMIFIFFALCALDESSLSIGRAKFTQSGKVILKRTTREAVHDLENYMSP